MYLFVPFKSFDQVATSAVFLRDPGALVRSLMRPIRNVTDLGPIHSFHEDLVIDIFLRSLFL